MSPLSSAAFSLIDCGVAVLHIGRTLGRAVFLTLALATPARAQTPELLIGDRVRVRSATLMGMQHGHVTTVGPDSLGVALDLGGPPLPIALRDIAWLEVSQGRPEMREAGLWTGGIFAVLGGALGFLFFSECDGDVCRGFIVENAGQRALAVVGTGATFGAVGFVIGAVTVRERWSVLIDRLRP